MNVKIEKVIYMSAEAAMAPSKTQIQKQSTSPEFHIAHLLSCNTTWWLWTRNTQFSWYCVPTATPPLVADTPPPPPLPTIGPLNVGTFCSDFLQESCDKPS